MPTTPKRGALIGINEIRDRGVEWLIKAYECGDDASTLHTIPAFHMLAHLTWSEPSDLAEQVITKCKDLRPREDRTNARTSKRKPPAP